MDNCFFFALRKYLREGGYLVFRRSRMGSWFPHVLWVRDLKDAEVEHFVPEHKVPLRFPPPLFKGYVSKDDK